MKELTTTLGGLFFLSPAISNAQPAHFIESQRFTTEGLWRGVLGMVAILLVAYLFSNNCHAVNWHTIGIGLLLQLCIAVGILKVNFIQKGFDVVGSIFVLILDFTRADSQFLLGNLLDTQSFGYIFVFQALPIIILFSALTSLLFYLGVIQTAVKTMVWALSKLLNISGAESLSITGNIFLGQTEAPLMIKAYLPKTTRSEVLLVMIGGTATVAGGVVASYIQHLGGDDSQIRLLFARYLLAASITAAPGVVVISKILCPQTRQFSNNSHVSMENVGSNILDAIANGTADGLKLAANVGIMPLVFVVLITMMNCIFNWIGDLTTLNDVIATNIPHQGGLFLEMILGTIFSPVMWLIGIGKEDVMLARQLLGIKLVSSEFVAYTQSGVLKDLASKPHLLYNRSVMIATHMLCGFANFASVGIQIGGIGALAPNRRKTLLEFGLKAVLGGTLTSLLSTTIAGTTIG